MESNYITKYGERAFSRASRKLWNNLPIKIKMEHVTEKFKKQLKSHLMIHFDYYMLEVNRG